ncbi:hypothetical protein EXU85_21025 [Spirosoma sp. KCTC 42546]|uniref:hypothetical protein n=1 Tax=Spirosoma sp. KCTC 42546 TaxID=2520506 RepID=UPI0011595D1D|nr:hypothetical protein [Spirosoma sp. KCTC 42546]QDK80963.1 hypothetical protein EXU85_21025 [Spirosoma sp. KCTC 42546]
MKTLSYWASRHVSLAIFLIILGELANGVNGVLLGATLVGEFPLIYLYVCMLVLIGLAIYVQLSARQLPSATHYWLGRRWLFVAFLSNFLLFGLLGGIWNQRVQTQQSTASVFGGRRIVVAGDSLSPVDSVRRSTQPEIKATPSDTPKSPRGLYIVLGILGIAVAYVVTGLACNIACAGNGFLALLAFYLGLGGLAGSFYYVSKAVQKTPKRRRDMTVDERKRDSRRFWLPWVILIGIASVLLLVGATK